MTRMAPERRREELIAAAVRVIAREGVAAASVRAIVKEAGMPLGAFHYVFESHDELMRSVIVTVTEGEHLAAEISSLEATTVEAAVRSGLDAYIDLLQEQPQRELALFELAFFARRRKEHDLLREQYQTYLRTAEELLGYAASLTGSRWTTPVGELARHLVTVIDGITTTWFADQDTPAARRTAAFAAAAFAAHAVPATEERSLRADRDR